MIKFFKKYFCFISFVFCSTENNLDTLLDNAISDLYNYNFISSKSKLDSINKIDPYNPISPFLTVIVDWLYNQTEFGYDESYKAINDGSKKNIRHYKNLLKEYPQNAEYYLYLGSTYGMRARVSLAHKDWLGVMSSSYIGFRYLRKSNKIDPLLYDYYLTKGLIEYFLCISSIPIQMGGKMMGFEADCDVGKENLELALSSSEFAWIESANILTYIYLYLERDYHNALRTITPLVEQFPGHPFFAFLKAETLAKLNRWEELELMWPTLEQFTRKGNYLQKNECKLKLKYIESIHLFNSNKNKEVIEKTDWIINNYHMEFDWLLGLTYMIRGKTYDKLGMTDLAKKEYKMIIKLNNYFPEVEEAKKIIK